MDPKFNAAASIAMDGVSQVLRNLTPAEEASMKSFAVAAKREWIALRKTSIQYRIFDKFLSFMILGCLFLGFTMSFALIFTFQSLIFSVFAAIASAFGGFCQLLNYTVAPGKNSEQTDSLAGELHRFYIGIGSRLNKPNGQRNEDIEKWLEEANSTVLRLFSHRQNIPVWIQRSIDRLQDGTLADGHLIEAAANKIFNDGHKFGGTLGMNNRRSVLANIPGSLSEQVKQGAEVLTNIKIEDE